MDEIKKTEPPTFPAATFYDVDDQAEQLSHETAGEAIEAHLDSMADIDRDALSTIRNNSPLSVTAYARKPMDEKFAAREAGRLIGDAAESYAEEYGGPDGEPEFAAGAIAQAEAKIAAALKDLFASEPVWQCEPIGTVTLSAEQVEALMRKLNPHWFDSEPAKQVSP